MFCSAPCTNSASGSPSRHAALVAHSAFSPITQDPPLGPPAEPPSWPAGVGWSCPRAQTRY
jgi:hypothetical protein